MDPTLGMNDVGYTSTGTTNREFIATAGQIVKQRLNFIFGINHEFIRCYGWSNEDIRHNGHRQYHTSHGMSSDTDQRAAANYVPCTLVACLSFVHQNAWLHNLMIQPFAVVVFDNRRKKLLIMWRTDISDSVFHRIFWI